MAYSRQLGLLDRPCVQTLSSPSHTSVGWPEGGRRTGDVHNVRDVSPAVDGGDQRDARPRQLVRVARDADDAQVRLGREVLDCGARPRQFRSERDRIAGRGCRRTGERRPDRAPAGVPEVCDDALLERGPDLLARELVVLGAAGHRARCGKELDEQPAVL